jgi:hypothetical protein
MQRNFSARTTYFQDKVISFKDLHFFKLFFLLLIFTSSLVQVEVQILKHFQLSHKRFYVISPQVTNGTVFVETYFTQFYHLNSVFGSLPFT